MSIKEVSFDFEKYSYIPDAISFSIVSRPVAEHDFIMASYEDVVRSMQKPEIKVTPAKIESILRVVVLYTEYRDKTSFFPEMRPRDIDLITRAFERLLSQHETRLEHAINSVAHPDLNHEHCLQLGRSLTQISTRQQTNPTVANAKKLFSKVFASHVIHPEVMNLNEWIVILVQTHPKLVWLKRIVKIGPNDEKLKAIVSCFQKQHAQNSDVELFLCAYEAYHSDFRQALTLFRALLAGRDNKVLKNKEVEAINFRFQQITKCSPPLSKIDQLRIAIWSETKIPNRFETKLYHKTETGLGAHVLYDVYGDLYLIVDNISCLKLPYTLNQEASWVDYESLKNQDQHKTAMGLHDQ